MKSRHLHMPARFARTAGEAFRDATYANPFHAPTRKRSVARWIGWSAFALLCLGLIAKGTT